MVGQVLAAPVGYLPGYLWILIGAVLGGAVHDLVVLIASSRHEARFLPLLIAGELGPWAGFTTMRVGGGGGGGGALPSTGSVYVLLGPHL